MHIQQTPSPKEFDGVPESDNESVREINRNNINNSKNKSSRLHCFDVWYPSQLPWQAYNALSDSCDCLFSVVQSSSGADPNDLLLLWRNNSNRMEID